MIYGYVRASTDAQELTTQVAQLKAAGCEHGDGVIIPAVDRLSRDTTDLLVIARDLQKAGAGLRSIAEPVVDTTALAGVAAKPERRRVKERTALGRANAKARWAKFGRKPKLTERQRKEAIKRRENGEETMRGSAQGDNVSYQTISRIML